MGCNDKITSTCGKKTQAKCVNYQGKLSTKSELEECDCLQVEEVIEDINSQLDAVYESIDVSSVSSECMEYGNDPNIPSILQTHADKICEITEFIGLGDCPGCGPSPDPCSTEVNCCGGVVVGLKYWTGDLPLPTTLNSWILHTGNTLKHTINSGSGYYKVTIEHGIDFESEGAVMDVGLRVNLVDPTTTVTGFDITRMRSYYPKTIILYVNLNQGDIITPVYKRTVAGIVQFDIVKMMIEKIAYIPG